MDNALVLLAAWMPQQRWYATKTGLPRLRAIASWDLPGDGVLVRTHLIADDGSTPPTLYQVPTVARPTDTVGEDAVVIGELGDGTTLVDGAHDPAFTGPLLRLVTAGGTATGPGMGATGRAADAPPPIGTGYLARVLSGEQSNTSIVYRTDGDGAPVIVKVFRQLHAGLNPDVELTTALSTDGSPYVARAVGSVEGEWPDAAGADDAARGSLVFAQEFLPGVEDAWRVALRAAVAGEDFTARARALGEATADVHTRLAELFPVRTTDAAARRETARRWQRRLAAAVAEVPQLAERAPAIEAVYARAADDAWPALQRVHGDYHLGQVILVPGRGWVLLDFEGEPLRPMSERLEPDLAVRDVAGMMRSFDYVAGSLQLDDPHRAATGPLAWARASRDAFVAGYEEAAGIPVSGALLDALELDKAVYEALYEARNRPTWLPIPLGAIARLTAG